MRKLRSTRRKIATTAAVIAVGSGATLGTASSASADIRGPVPCNPRAAP